MGVCEGRSKREFRPYEDSTLDTPLGHFLLKPFLPCVYPLIRVLLPIRWFLSRPLSFHVIPVQTRRCVSSGTPTRVRSWFACLDGVTWGNVLMATPQIAILYFGCVETFVSESVEGSGGFSALALILAYLTSYKNAALNFFAGISYERLVPYHNLSATVAVILGFFHVYAAFAFEDADSLREKDSLSRHSLRGDDPDLTRFFYDNRKNASGTNLILFMFVLVVSSFWPSLRRARYNLWLFVHIVSSVLVIVYSVRHAIYLMVIIAFFWVVDVFVRHVVMLVKYPIRATLSRTLPDLVEIRFPKGNDFDYRAGQFVRIAVPTISAVEFHTVTLSSAPQEPYVKLHVKVLGDWSRRLHELSVNGRDKEIVVFMDGPYGSLSVDLDNDRKYQRMLMISGGIGVTPCLSLAKSLLRQHERGRRLSDIRFVWAVRDLNMAMCLSPFPESSETDRSVRSPDSLAEPIESTRLLSPSRSSSSSEEKKDESSTDFDAAWSSNFTKASDLPKNAHPIKVDVYLTKQTKTKDVEQSFQSLPHIHHGRPDLNAIFAETKEEAVRGKDGSKFVAVIACGPQSLIAEVRDLCRRHSVCELAHCCGVTFDLHEEVFEY